MKNLYSFLIILTFFASCNEDLNVPHEVNTNAITNRVRDVLPLNSDNPYDKVGLFHNELFETYYEGINLPNNIVDMVRRVDSIARSSALFISLADYAYQLLSASRVAYIVQHKRTCVAQVITNSSLSADAEVNLAGFINMLVTHFDTGCSGELLYDYVAKYEDIIINNPNYTSKDKKIILITTSVARHSSYRARKRPKNNFDPDWIVLVGNVIAATEGVEESDAKAATMALATGVAQN